jgi:hypothetical protein
VPQLSLSALPEDASKTGHLQRIVCHLQGRILALSCSEVPAEGSSLHVDSTICRNGTESWACWVASLNLDNEGACCTSEDHI